jgi:hypothetical protein
LAWVANNRIVLITGDGTRVKTLDLGQSAVDAQWSRDARTMLIVRDHFVYFVDLYSRKETRVAGPLDGFSPDWFGYTNDESSLAWSEAISQN